MKSQKNRIELVTPDLSRMTGREAPILRVRLNSSLSASEVVRSLFPVFDHAGYSENELQTVGFFSQFFPSIASVSMRIIFLVLVVFLVKL